MGRQQVVALVVVLAAVDGGGVGVDDAERDSSKKGFGGERVTQTEPAARDARCASGTSTL